MNRANNKTKKIKKMKEVKEYILISAIGIKELNEFVNTHIKTGWQPFGGICINQSKITQDEQTTYIMSFYQPMVKFLD